MEQICRRCFAPLKAGQRVSVVMTATYIPLKSKIAYALSNDDKEADADTLVHASSHDCEYED
jgi:hypothetical protein